MQPAPHAPDDDAPREASAETSELEPQAELAALAAALTAHARRAAARGVARAHVEQAQPARPAAAPAPKPPTRPVGTEAAAAAAPSLAVPPALAPLPANLPAARPAAAESVKQTVPPTVALAQACATLEELRAAVAACTACGLCATRTQTVFADGKGTRGVVFVGEAPGAEEDRSGVPFVGQAGQLLTDIIEKGMGIRRDEAWIVNVLKCRPPDNRDPSPEEKRMCTPWLDRQLELMRPKVVVPLGKHAANHLLGRDSSLGQLRQQVYERQGAKVVPTYHPAYLLRAPEEKKECWKDIQLAMRELGLPSGRK